MANDNDLMFDPGKDPLPFPLPIPGPWFPKYPQRAAMSFGDFVKAVNASPAESPVWAVVSAVDDALDASAFEGLRDALESASAPDDGLQTAFDALPKVADALRAGGGKDPDLVRLLHPFFLAVEWGLVQAP